MSGQVSRVRQEELSTQEALVWTAAGIVVASGLTFLIVRLVKQHSKRLEHDKSMDEGSAATYAKQIKMAFENDGFPGTNKEALRMTMRSIPSKQVFDDAVKSYRKQFSSNMLEDMASELQSSEYKEMMAILSAKPEKAGSGQPTVYNHHSWAQRLKAAFDVFPGTDEDAVKAVLIEVPTKADFRLIEQAYRSAYATDLMVDMKSEIEFWEWPEYQAILDSKP